MKEKTKTTFQRSFFQININWFHAGEFNMVTENGQAIYRYRIDKGQIQTIIRMISQAFFPASRENSTTS